MTYIFAFLLKAFDRKINVTKYSRVIMIYQFFNVIVNANVFLLKIMLTNDKLLCLFDK
jgi:hypothetical protein